jgi:septation ring formation regulator EzrA
MRYQRVVEERLGQLEDSLERLKENVNDNAITSETIVKRLERFVEQLTQIKDLVELEDED